MKIRVVSVCHNEAEMLPFYLRHYCSIADEVFVCDDQSTDGSTDIIKSVKSPKISLFQWSELGYPSGLNDELMMKFWKVAIEYARFDRVDWLVLPDIDEILWHPTHSALFRQACHLADKADFEVIAAQGWNMTGDGLPKDDGKSQIYELLNTGVPAPVYGKSIVLKPTSNVSWNRGRHAFENCNPRVSPPWLKLLHYRYLGYEYTKRRNVRNYERVGTDKGAAWSCAPTWKGDHSPEWAEEAKKLAVNALEAPL